MFTPIDIILLVSLAILGVALIVLTVKKRSRPLILFLSIVAVALSVFQIMRELERQQATVYNPVVDRALGHSLAEYFLPSAQENSENDPSIVVISYAADGETASDQRSRTRIESFLDKLGERGLPEPQLVSPASVLNDSASGASEDVADDVLWESGITDEVLRHVWENHPDADVVISMEALNHASLANSGAKELKPEESRFYVLHLMEYWNWTDAVETGFIDGLVTYRKDADWSVKEGSDERIFKSRFVFLTPENISEKKEQLPMAW